MNKFFVHIFTSLVLNKVFLFTENPNRQINSPAERRQIGGHKTQVTQKFQQCQQRCRSLAKVPVKKAGLFSCGSVGWIKNL